MIWTIKVLTASKVKKVCSPYFSSLAITIEKSCNSIQIKLLGKFSFFFLFFVFVFCCFIIYYFPGRQGEGCAGCPPKQKDSQHQFFSIKTKSDKKGSIKYFIPQKDFQLSCPLQMYSAWAHYEYYLFLGKGWSHTSDPNPGIKKTIWSTGRQKTGRKKARYCSLFLHPY